MNTPLSGSAGDPPVLRANELAELEALRREVEELRRAASKPPASPAQRGLELLADVGSLFASGLDPHQRLERLAKLVVPRFADWCAIDVVTTDGTYRRAVVEHQDPQKISLALELQRRFPPNPKARNGVPQVLRTGKMEWVAEVPENLLESLVQGPEHLRLVRALQVRSYVIVPLTASGKVLGAMTLVYSESDRRYSEGDLELANELAARASIALENARLFEIAEAASSHLRSLFMQAPVPIVIMRGPEHVIEIVNAPYEELVARKVIVGQTIRQTFPELAGQGIYELLDGVYRTGEPFHGNELPVRLRNREGVEEERNFTFIYQPMRGVAGAVEGIMVCAYEVTSQVKARDQAQQASELLRRRQAELALGADVGTAFTGSLSTRQMLQSCAEAMVKHLGAAFARIWTVDRRGDLLELQASAGLYTHVDGQHARVPIGKFKIGRIAHEAKPHLSNDVQQDPLVSDREWAKREGMVSFAGYPLVVDGKVIGVMAMFGRQRLSQDTLAALASIADSVAVGIQRKRAETRAHEESETLEVLNRVGQTIAAELDTEKLVQAITDSATRLTGAQFGAFFYNVIDERGEAYTLYSIAGVPREAFSKFPMPRNTKIFAPTFGGEGVVRVDDIRKDPRYGHNPPYNGMPAGHLPVVSYLAVPVTSRDGRVIGGLFFGHEKEGVFTERAERLAVGVAAQAAIAMDNARLFREAQRLIQALERSNQELDQFAYVTSHDLKAPLRGIANLSQWLEEDLGAAITPESKKQLDLLRRRVHRMENLIDGILQYSRAGRVRGKPETIDVGRLLSEAVEMLSPTPPARIEIAPGMPTVFCEKIPLQQVLMNLITNALKHARREDACVELRAQEQGDRWQFTVADNGPGIAPEFHERIWGIFQTLEARDKVEGTGIGLAIVRKIVETRGGRAWVESAPGTGAMFHFTWPKKEGLPS